MKLPQNKKIVETLKRRGVSLDDRNGRVVVQFRGNAVKRGFQVRPDLADDIITADRHR